MTENLDRKWIKTCSSGLNTKMCGLSISSGARGYKPSCILGKFSQQCYYRYRHLREGGITRLFYRNCVPLRRCAHSRCIVIRFMWVSAKFGTCTVMSVNGALVEDKIRRFKGECAHFSFKNFPFTLTTVQVPNLALTHTKRITVTQA